MRCLKYKDVQILSPFLYIGPQVRVDNIVHYSLVVYTFSKVDIFFKKLFMT